MIDDLCGCRDYSVSRRSLLKAAGLASMAGVVTSMFGDVMTSTSYGATNGNVLVVVSMRGGVDGMSLVVPYAEQAYHDARPTGAIAGNDVLWPDGTFGLHPKMTPLESMWLGGNMAALHAVGLPAPNRSHFDAMEVLEDADPGSSERIGWINRLIQDVSGSPGGDAPDIFDALQIGSPITPTALTGPAPVLATEGFDDLGGPFRNDPNLKDKIADGLRAQYARTGGLLQPAAAGALDLSARASSINAVVQEGPLPGAVYPKYSELGAALRTTAALIRSGVGVKAVAVDAGGWDHHVDLKWRMDGLVSELATCLSSFFVDLGVHASRVTVVTLSEFGRRLQENGSRGLDHGYGNAVLAMGAGVKGRNYYARWPGLGVGKQVDGDLAVTTDYRSVLTEILRSRFPAVDTTKVFPGLSYEPLGFMT